MGCIPQKGKTTDNFSTPINISKSIPTESQSISTLKEIKTKNDVEFNISNFITEKAGKITDQYMIMNPALGKGAYGEVRKGVHKTTGLTRAIKIINKQSTSLEDQKKLLNEVNILRELDHPNIIKIFEFYQDEKFFYIVTELCTGGELFDKIIDQKSFSEKKAALIMKQLLSAVFYCHIHKIVHRDLKPENLLFESAKEDSLIKVIDFGTSKVFDPSQKMNQKFGTPYYIAPEVLKKKYDEKCDIWSCGIIMYVLLCGYPPFNGPNDKAIMEKVSKGVFNFNGEEWTQISNEAKNFIIKMLEIDPLKRYNAEQANNDPWIKKYASVEIVEIPIMTKALENMRNFRAERKLQEATWIFLVNYLATKEEKNQLLKTFQSLDLNGDGQLSREELLIGYRKIMNKVQADEEVDRIMINVDKNNSGAIDYTEFVMATISRENLLTKQRLDLAFKMFDKDGSGKVSINELKEVFGGEKIPDKVWFDMIKEVDDNGDGEISYKEFRDMMSNLLNH